MLVSVKELLSLFNDGKYTEAKSVLPTFDNPLNYLFEANIFSFFSQNKEALALLSKYDEQYQELSDPHKLCFLSAKTEALYRLYNFQELKQVFTEAESLIQENDSKNEEQLFWEGNFYLYKGYYHGLTGDFEEALGSYYKVMEYYRSLSYPYLLGKIYEALGEIYLELRDYEKAKELLEIGLNKIKDYSCHKERGYLLSNIGVVHEKRGNLREAENHYRLSVEEFMLTETPTRSYLSELRLGNLILIKGELDKAQDIFEQIYESGAKRGFKIQQSLALFHLALVHKRKGDYEKSLELLQMTLEIQNMLDNQINISDTLLEMVKVALYNNSKAFVEESINKLKELAEIDSNPIIELRHRMAKAMLFKSESRLKDKLEAQNIFQKIANDPYLEESDIKNLALVNLCDLLVFEIRSSRDPSLLKEVYHYLDQIQEHAEMNRSSIIKMEVMFLRSKFLIAETRIVEGIKLLNTVYETSQDLGVEEIRERVYNEIHRIKTEVEQMQNIDTGRILEESNLRGIEEYLTELSRILR